MRLSATIGATRTAAATTADSARRYHERLGGLTIAALLLLAGCGTSPTDRALSGAGIGAGAGVIAGAVVGFPAAGAAVGALAGAGVGAATTPREATADPPPRPDPPPNPDRSVMTYLSKTQGLTGAREQNRRAARHACGGGFVLVDETRGTDAYGAWVMLVYGCLADARNESDPAPEKNPVR
jgi:hypothetical protein